MDLMEKIVSLCKRRGFVFPTSEIYGGLISSYDYGPQTKLLGAFEYDDILKYENIIVIDDDTIYSKHLIEQYEINFQDIQKTVYSPGSKKIKRNRSNTYR